MKYPKILLASLLSSSLLLSACGSDTTNKEPTDADITAENSKDLAVAATESTKQAIASDNAPSSFGGGFKPSSNKFDIESFSQKVIEQNNQAVDGLDLSSFCTGGGSISSDFSGTNTTSGSITYNQCDMGMGGTINGTVNFTYGTNSYSIKYKDFTVTYSGITETFDFSMDCTYSSNGDDFTCDTSSTALGLDGRKYTVKNMNVSGSSSSGYDVSAEVVDPDYGIIEINAQDVLFDCADGSPSTGSISFSAKGKSASVDFNSCTSFTVTVDGVGTSYNWSDI